MNNSNIAFALDYLRNNQSKIDFDKLFQRLTGKFESEKILKESILQAIKDNTDDISINITSSQLENISKTLTYLKESSDMYYWKSQIIDLSFENKIAHLIQNALVDISQTQDRVCLSDFGAGVILGKASTLIQ